MREHILNIILSDSRFKLSGTDAFYQFLNPDNPDFNLYISDSMGEREAIYDLTEDGVLSIEGKKYQITSYDSPEEGGAYLKATDHNGHEVVFEEDDVIV